MKRHLFFLSLALTLLLAFSFWILVSPTGLPIAADDDSGDGVNVALTEYRLPASGSYVLFITYSGSDGEVDLAFDLSD